MESNCSLCALWENLAKLWIWETRKEFGSWLLCFPLELQSGSRKCRALPLSKLYIIFISFLLPSISQNGVCREGAVVFLSLSSWSVLWEYIGNMSQSVPTTSRCIHRQKSSLHSIKQQKKPTQKLILVVLKSSGDLKRCAHVHRHWKKAKKGVCEAIPAYFS